MENNHIEEELKKLLSSSAGVSQISVVPLAQSGSNRRYYRLYSGDDSYIGTYVPDPAEGKCFVALARGFRQAGREVPEVMYVSPDGRLYIQEDLGDISLFASLSNPDSKDNIKETLKRLVALQQTPELFWVDKCLSNEFCKRQVMWDLNYFKYEYLKPQEIIYDEDRLEDDFERLSDRLTSIPDEFCGFMMRDCQSRNVMLTERGPVFIDFQGGRRGPALYDAVSLLWQARAGFDSELRIKMLDYFCDTFCKGNELKKKEMLSWLDEIIIFRTLQVLGAYGFRGLVQHKAHFLLSIPGALINLHELLERGALDQYAELKKCCLAISSDSFMEKSSEYSGLTVEIFSFSYKKGYPVDMSGNGGGFMFDCRALHNPGRFEKYRSLTGRDKAVIEFLEDKGEIQSFLKNAWSLIDTAIERYLSRGFTRLQVGFGCTGGQHRSVYSAERTSAHVSEKFPEVNVCLIHREHPEE
ncbi:MAG: phosphotransferase [Muribaculaceae bacterium]|nr:phosphotransferase [Muribaculaceae bacterium]